MHRITPGALILLSTNSPIANHVWSILIGIIQMWFVNCVRCDDDVPNSFGH